MTSGSTRRWPVGRRTRFRRARRHGRGLIGPTGDGRVVDRAGGRGSLPRPGTGSTPRLVASLARTVVSVTLLQPWRSVRDRSPPGGPISPPRGISPVRETPWPGDESDWPPRWIRPSGSSATGWTARSCWPGQDSCGTSGESGHTTRSDEPRLARRPGNSPGLWPGPRPTGTGSQDRDPWPWQ